MAYAKVAEGPRRAYDPKKGGAAYGTHRTIASAMCQGKPHNIVAARWNYQPGRVTLVKGKK